MKINNKKYITIGAVVVFILLGILLVQGYAKKKLEQLIVEKMPAHFVLKYTDIKVNLLSATIILNEVAFKISNQDSILYHTNIKAESVEIKKISYWDLCFNDKLTIEKVAIEKPKFTYYPYKKNSSKKTAAPSNNKGLQSLSIKNISLTNGSLAVMKKSRDSIKMALSSYNLTILGVRIDLKSKQKTAVIYDSYQLNAQDVLLNNSFWDQLKIDTLAANKTELKMINFQIIPKYSKKELSTHLRKERDYIKLHIPQIVLKEFDFNFNKPRLAVAATSGEIIRPNLEVYRDKLIADDTTTKALYSKSLRNLSFDLNINQLKIRSGFISYAELVDPEKKAGAFFFDEVGATISSISNLKKAKKTIIKVQSRLMGKAPLTLNWTFDVNNTADEFSVNGAVSHLNATLLNPFFKPNLNALAEGTLQQMYFSFYGNTRESKGEMKMKYEDFNFKILRKNSNKINTILTAIGTIFIRKDSKSDPKDFRYGAIQAERDSSKSFFNYLWINVKSGIVSTLMGNGKKE